MDLRFSPQAATGVVDRKGLVDGVQTVELVDGVTSLAPKERRKRKIVAVTGLNRLFLVTLPEAVDLAVGEIRLDDRLKENRIVGVDRVQVVVAVVVGKRQLVTELSLDDEARACAGRNIIAFLNE